MDIDAIPLWGFYLFMVGPLVFACALPVMLYLGVLHAAQSPLVSLMSRQARRRLTWVIWVVRVSLVVVIAELLVLAWLYHWAWLWWMVILAWTVVLYVPNIVASAVALHRALDGGPCAPHQLRLLLQAAARHGFLVRGGAVDNVLVLKIGTTVYRLKPSGATADELADIATAQQRNSAGDGITRMIIRRSQRRGGRKRPNRPND